MEINYYVCWQALKVQRLWSSAPDETLIALVKIFEVLINFVEFVGRLSSANHAGDQTPLACGEYP